MLGVAQELVSNPHWFWLTGCHVVLTQELLLPDDVGTIQVESTVLG